MGWLAYLVDVKHRLLGISSKKTEWLRGWIEDVLARKSVLGRDMRAALDRQDKPGELHGIAPGGSAHPHEVLPGACPCFSCPCTSSNAQTWG